MVDFYFSQRKSTIPWEIIGKKSNFASEMRHLDFDDLWKNHLFDYKDGDLLVIDDIEQQESKVDVLPFLLALRLKPLPD